MPDVGPGSWSSPWGTKRNEPVVLLVQTAGYPGPLQVSAYRGLGCLMCAEGRTAVWKDGMWCSTDPPPPLAARRCGSSVQSSRMALPSGCYDLGGETDSKRRRNKCITVWECLGPGPRHLSAESCQVTSAFPGPPERCCFLNARGTIQNSDLCSGGSRV